MNYSKIFQERELEGVSLVIHLNFLELEIILRVFLKITEYSELEGTHKDLRVQILSEQPIWDQTRDLGVIITIL